MISSPRIRSNESDEPSADVLATSLLPRRASPVDVETRENATSSATTTVDPAPQRLLHVHPPIVTSTPPSPSLSRTHSPGANYRQRKKSPPLEDSDHPSSHRHREYHPLISSSSSPPPSSSSSSSLSWPSAKTPWHRLHQLWSILVGKSGRRRAFIVCFVGLFLSTLMFSIYDNVYLASNDSSSSLRPAAAAASFWRLRQAWLRRAFWLSPDDDDGTEAVAAINATEVPSMADPPQRLVLEEQLFTRDTQEERKRRVDAICDRYDLRGSPLELDRADLKQMIVDDNNRLMYCYIPKVACTNWKRIMMILTGSAGSQKKPMDIQASDSHLRNGFKTLDQYSEAEILFRVKNYLKFMFVRHPFERLLSAYKNKFSERYSVYFQKKFGRKIIRRYRPEAKVESLVYGNDVTFREFVTYVLDPRTHVEGLNEHWRQYYKLCHPCHLNYDVIGKYETLYPDAQRVLEAGRVAERVAFPTYPPTEKKRAKTLDYIRDFFATIPDNELKDLKATYGLDFEFFGYKYPFVNDSSTSPRSKDEG